MVLHRGDAQQRSAAREIAARALQREVLLERPVPPPALPRDRPPLAVVARAAALDLHARLVDRPGRHGPCAPPGLPDDGPQDRERPPGPRAFFQLPLVPPDL